MSRLLLIGGLAALIGACASGESSDRPDLARTTARKLAFEVYPQWLARPGNIGKCPTASELAEYGGSAKDPWGEDYVVKCGELPPGAAGVAVSSKGKDKREGTADDIKSWE